MATTAATLAADEPKKADPPAATSSPAATAAPAAGETKDAAKAADAPPSEPVAYNVAKATEKGKLKNPFTDNPEAIEQGRKLYLSYSCNGCHGGGGGGGMCPPLTNETWVYGSDDDTLYRLVIYGSKELQENGYPRKQKEAVTGPMPAYKDIIKSEEHMCKIMAFIRSVWRGDPKRRNW